MHECVCVQCVWYVMEPIPKKEWPFFPPSLVGFLSRVTLALDVVFGLAFSVTDVKTRLGTRERLLKK